MDDPDRKLKQDMFLRVCRDSGYMMCPIQAAQIAAAVLKCSPLEMMIALDWQNMERIADGTHPAVQSP